MRGLDASGRSAGRVARAEDRSQRGEPRSARSWTSRSRRSEARPLEGRYPYVFVDAKVEKVRAGGRVVPKCVVVAHAVHETGRREIIGLDVGEAETEAFWREFLRSLVKRGLTGVQLAISDAHPGLKAALAQVLGCPWQRCSVHFLRDCLGHARKDQHGLLAALIRPLFNQPDREAASAALTSGGRAARTAAAEGSGVARGGRGGRARLLLPSPPSTGASSAPPTRSSVSTARSAAAPTSSASSPTTAR